MSACRWALWTLLMLPGLALAQAPPLASGGRSDYRICHDANAPESVKLAAREVKRVLRASTGAELAITTEFVSPAIVLGDMPAAREAGIQAEQVPYEGYVLRTRGRDVFIVGRDVAPGQEKWQNHVSTGTLFGAYTFLENVVGARWLMPGEVGEVIPHREELALPQLDVQEEPGFPFRCLEVRRYRRPSPMSEWQTRLKTHFHYRISFGHSFDDYPPLAVVQKHPEFMRVHTDGRRDPVPARKDPAVAYCLTEPGLIQAFADALMEEFEKNPKRYAGVMSPSDGYDGCDCPACARMTLRDDGGKWNRFGGTGRSITPLLLHFYASVGRIVGEKYPDRIVGGLIYRNYQYPPDPPFRLPPNVVADIAQLNAYGFKYYKPEREAEFRALLPAWAKFTDLLGWSDYSTWMRDAYGVILPPGRTIHKMIFPALKKHRFLMVNWTGQGALAYGGVHNYMVAKLLWNPNADVDAIYRDYLDHAYGEDAARCVDLMYEVSEKALMAYIRAYDKPREPDYDVDLACMKAVSAPNFAEYEKLYAEALGRVKTKPQRQRLEMLGDVLTVMHFNLRNAGLVANPEASAFFKRDEDYRHFLKAPERVLGLSPEMLLDKDGRVPMLFTPEKRTLNVVSLAGKQPPRIDGDLSDDAWGGAEATGEFRLRGARAPAGQQTQVRAAFDSTALYVAVACREKDAARIQKRCDTADSVAIFSDDVVEVFLGHRPNFEQTYWHVALNPGGGRYDAVAMEKDYNLKFEGAAKVGDDGWTVEVAIPFASLGLQGPPLGQTWRVNVCRQRRPDPVEYSTWSAIEAHFHEPANFGYWVFPPK